MASVFIIKIIISHVNLLAILEIIQGTLNSLSRLCFHLIYVKISIKEKDAMSLRGRNGGDGESKEKGEMI